MSRAPLALQIVPRGRGSSSSTYRLLWCALLAVGVVQLLVAAPGEALATSSSSAANLEDCTFYFSCPNEVYPTLQFRLGQCECRHTIESWSQPATLRCNSDTGCSGCTTGENRCSGCRVGYTYNTDTNVCVRTCFVDNCLTCDPANNGLCQSCQRSFQISADRTRCTYTPETGGGNNGGGGNGAVKATSVMPVVVLAIISLLYMLLL